MITHADHSLEASYDSWITDADLKLEMTYATLGSMFRPYGHLEYMILYIPDVSEAVFYLP